MKKFIAFTAAAAIALSAAASAADFGKTVVLGDSIASGYGLEGYFDGDNYSAAESFGNRLAAECSGYVNLAVDGRTTAQLLEALNSAEMSEAVSQADDIIISIGGNDFLQPMLTAVQMAMFTNPEIMNLLQGGDFADIDLEAFSAYISTTVLQAVENVDTAKSGENVRSILTKIHDLSPKAEVKLLTVYNPLENADKLNFTAAGEGLSADSIEAISFASVFSTLGGIAETKIAQLNYELVNAAEACGAEIIDVYSAFKGHAAEYTNVMYLDVHPNSSGHAVIYSLLGGSVPTAALPKGSPETGADSAALLIGVSALSAAAAVLLKKKL